MKNEIQLIEALATGVKILEQIKNDLDYLKFMGKDKNLENNEIINADYYDSLNVLIFAWHSKVESMLDNTEKYEFINVYVPPALKPVNTLHELYTEIKAYCDFLNDLLPKNQKARIKNLSIKDKIILDDYIVLKAPSDKYNQLLIKQKVISISPICAYLIQHLYQIRNLEEENRGLSREELAKKLNCKPKTLSTEKAKLKKICGENFLKQIIFIDQFNKWSINPELKCCKQIVP